jgi:hypothetical protein
MTDVREELEGIFLIVHVVKGEEPKSGKRSCFDAVGEEANIQLNKEA